jgi:MFS family permease
MPAEDQISTAPINSGATGPIVLINFSLCIFTFTAANFMLQSFLPIYIKSQGISDGELGSILGLVSISALVLMLPLGVLSDLFSPRRLVLFGGSIFLLFAGGILTVSTYWQFLLIAPLGGVASSAFYIVLYALFLKVIDRNQVGKKIALYQSGMYLGFGIGPAIGGLLVREGGFTALLLGVLAGGLVVIALILRLPQSETFRLDLGGYQRDLSQNRTLLFLLLAFVYATHFGVEQTSFTLLMKESLGFPAIRIGLVYLAIGSWMAMIAPFAGHRFDADQNLRTLLVCGLVISGIFQIATSMVGSFPYMVAVRLCHTVGDVMLILSMGVMTAAFFPESRMGGSSAVVFATRTCGVFTGNLGSGFINGALGYGLSFIVSGGVVLIFVIVAGAAMGRLLIVKDDLQPVARAEHTS